MRASGVHLLLASAATLGRQVIYHFIQGYTSKMAGTEVGISETTAAFSSCYGEPFLVWCASTAGVPPECRGRPPNLCQATDRAASLAGVGTRLVATLPLSIRCSRRVASVAAAASARCVRIGHSVECVWRSKPIRM